MIVAVVTMHADVLAEAGLSDCARVGVCSDFGSDAGVFLLVFVAVVGLVGVALLLAMLATVDIATRSTGTRRGLAWTVLVWLVPVGGALMWWKSGPRRPTG